MSDSYRTDGPKGARGETITAALFDFLTGGPGHIDRDRINQPITEAVGTDLIEVLDAKEDNRVHGDLRLPAGHTVEVKTQDVGDYAANVIELAQNWRVARPGSEPVEHRRTAMADLAGILSIPQQVVENTTVTVRDKGPITLGEMTEGYVSVSISSFANAEYVAYVNVDADASGRRDKVGTRVLVMLYRSEDLRSALADALLDKARLDINTGGQNNHTGTITIKGIPYPGEKGVGGVVVEGVIAEDGTVRWNLVTRRNGTWEPVTESVLHWWSQQRLTPVEALAA